MARPVTVTTTVNATADSDALVAAAPSLMLLGFTAKETAVSPAIASFEIKHGDTGNGGTLLSAVGLGASGFVAYSFPGEGIPVPDGVSLNFVAGRYTVALFTRTVNA